MERCTYMQSNKSGLLLPNYIIKKQRGPIAFDFFAGCGGFSLGFIQGGWNVVGALEWEPYASITYMVNLGSYPINIHYIGENDKERLNKACEKCMGLKKKAKAHNSKWDTPHGLYRRALGSGLSGSGWIKNNPDKEPVRHFWFGDVRKIKGKDILNALGIEEGDLDCVMGGPPCQGFSRAGKQQTADPRNNLVYEYARMIVELQPKTFVMEEVPDIVNFFDPDGVPVLDKFCLMLQEGGYGKWEKLKKSLLMQTNAGACIKSTKGNAKLSRPKKNKSITKQQINQVPKQMSLLG